MRPHWHQANPNVAREPVASAASSEGAQARHHPQPAIDRLVLDSPRLAARRRQIDALFSPAAHRNAAMEKGATQMKMKAGPVAAYGSGQSRSSSVEAPAQLIRTTVKRVNGKETVAEPDYAPSQDRITRVIVRRQLLNDAQLTRPTHENQPCSRWAVPSAPPDLNEVYIKRNLLTAPRLDDRNSASSC